MQAVEAVQRQALERYRQTIQGAFREVNDALIDTQKSREELIARGLRVAALKDFARLSQQRFDEGVTSYLEVLVAQNELFSAELAHAQNQADSLTQLVNVYKAMGGWKRRSSPPPYLAKDERSRFRRTCDHGASISWLSSARGLNGELKGPVEILFTIRPSITFPTSGFDGGRPRGFASRRCRVIRAILA